LPRIALKNLTPGMQLSRSVLNGGGAMLVDQGVKVSEDMIRKLANAGIRYVFVVDRLDEDPLAEALSALEGRFAVTGDEPHMGRLKRLLKEHLQELYS
jgi:hypothetical protein